MGKLKQIIKNPYLGLKRINKAFYLGLKRIIKHPFVTGAIYGAILAIVGIYFYIFCRFIYAKYDIIGLIAVIGAVPGIISLFWQIHDKFLKKPNLSVSAEISYEDDKPHKIWIISVNHGNTNVEIVRAGFIFDNKMVYRSEFQGLLPHIVKAGGVPHKIDFTIKEIRDSIRTVDGSIKYVYVQDTQWNIHKDTISEDILNALREIPPSS